MLKIDTWKADNTKKIQNKSNKASSVSSNAFATEVANAVQSAAERDLESLLSNLDEQERKFLSAQDLQELQNYKELIQKILKLISSEAFENKTFRRPPSQKNKANFLVTKKINEKLIELTKRIGSNNKAFNLLKEMEEIRGLILDLVN